MAMTEEKKGMVSAEDIREYLEKKIKESKRWKDHISEIRGYKGTVKQFLEENKADKEIVFSALELADQEITVMDAVLTIVLQELDCFDVIAIEFLDLIVEIYGEKSIRLLINMIHDRYLK